MIDSLSSQVSALAQQGRSTVEARSSAPRDSAASQASVAQASTSVELSAAVSVELSDRAQAKQLRTEGYSVAEISTKLGLDEDTIDGYLNIRT